jgi:hypothetical protein
MAKKIDEAEVKKECPSCGLGVALDSTICEFCGWDFEEEDEWILQIEKLERDLMLEKQNFEPGSVNEKIQSTLHSPAEEMKAIKSAEKSAPAKAEPRPTPPPRPSPARKPEPAVAPAPVRAAAPKSAPKPAPAPRPAAASQKVRRIRTVKKAEPESAGQAPEDTVQPQKKVRVVRKVK